LERLTRALPAAKVIIQSVKMLVRTTMITLITLDAG